MNQALLDRESVDRVSQTSTTHKNVAKAEVKTVNFLLFKIISL